MKIASLVTIQSTDKFQYVCEKQREDELCKEIKVYLETGELDQKYENKKPEWAKEIEYFEVVSGVLY